MSRSRDSRAHQRGALRCRGRLARAAVGREPLPVRSIPALSLATGSRRRRGVKRPRSLDPRRRRPSGSADRPGGTAAARRSGRGRCPPPPAESRRPRTPLRAASGGATGCPSSSSATGTSSASGSSRPASSSASSSTSAGTAARRARPWSTGCASSSARCTTSCPVGAARGGRACSCMRPVLPTVRPFRAAAVCLFLRRLPGARGGTLGVGGGPRRRGRAAGWWASGCSTAPRRWSAASARTSSLCSASLAGMLLLTGASVAGVLPPPARPSPARPRDVRTAVRRAAAPPREELAELETATEATVVHRGVGEFWSGAGPLPGPLRATPRRGPGASSRSPTEASDALSGR